MSIYKSFDSSEFLFEVIWKKFPNIKTYFNNNEIVNELIITSQEFCNLKKSKYFSLKYLSEGSFGDVAKISVKNEPIKAAVLSLSSFGGKNNLFYVDVVVKTSKRVEALDIIQRGNSVVSIKDPMSDMVFGSIMGHLFDVGTSPFVVKYFGNYICNNPTETSLIIESADHELYKLMNRKKSNIMSGQELRSILWQFMYCCFINKAYFGLIHFDSHLRNIMLKDIHNTYMYHGKVLSSLKYIAYDTKINNDNNVPIIVIDKMPKKILKLIDYGCMLACFDRSSAIDFKRDLRIETDISNMAAIGASDALSKSHLSLSFANTVDVLFTLLNVFEYMRIGQDGMGADTTSERMIMINELFKATFDMTAFELIQQRPDFTTKIGQNGQYDWFMRNHSSGLNDNKFNDVRYLTAGMINMCKYNEIVPCPFKDSYLNGKQVNFTSIDKLNTSLITEDNTLFLTGEITDYVKGMNRLENIIKFEKKCKTSKIFCKIKKLYSQPPEESFQEKKIFTNNVNFSITEFDYSKQFKPLYGISKWLGSSPIKNNQLISNIKFKLIEINSFSNASLKLNDKMINTSGITIPNTIGHYFNNEFRPLGYTSDGKTMLINPYPSVYHKYLAVLFSIDGKTITTTTYKKFIESHQTITKSILINNSEKEDQLFPKTPGKYKWACTAGPILVWKSDIVFNKNTLTSKSDVILHENYSKNLFISPYTNKTDYYGMQNSNEIQSHIIYILTRNKKINILLIDGGGKIAGVDMTAAAAICHNLGAEIAIRLYSGPASNILVLDKEEIYLSKSPFLSKYASLIKLNW